MQRVLTILFILILETLKTPAQDTIRMDLGGYPVIAVIKDGDTSYLSELEMAVIQPRKRAVATRHTRQYIRLVYNVRKVYPYAKLAGEKFGEIMSNIDSLDSGKDERQYIKQIEDEMLGKYEAELKNLTVTQGRILIKLIDRETSKTSYEVVKDLRGGFQAAFWQAIARLFGSNLKVEYDPEGEDKVIEEIMVMIENGQL